MPDLIVSSSIDTFMASINQAQMRTALSLGTLATQTANISDYITSTSAFSSFIPASSGSSFLTTTGASLTYLTINNAASNYLTIVSGASFLSSSAASSTYLSKSSASGLYQPLNSGLSSISLLSTSSFGRSGLTLSDASAARSYYGMENNVILDSSSSRILSLSDSHKYIKLTNAGGSLITVPPQSSVPWASGVEIFFRRSAGAGAISITGSGITFDGNTSGVSPSANFAIKNISTNSWDII